MKPHQHVAAVAVVAIALSLAAHSPAAAESSTVHHGQCRASVDDMLQTPGTPVLAWRRDQMVRDYTVAQGVVRVTYARRGCWRVTRKAWVS